MTAIPMTPDVSELVERLELAEAGSRELDGLVEVVVRDVSAARSGLAPEHWAKWRSNRFGNVGDGHTEYASAPVTTSLDAALALAWRVLPGWRVFIDAGGSGLATANVFDPCDPNTPWGTAGSSALALCLATLKALAVVGFSPSAQGEPIPTAPVSPPVVAEEQS